MSADFKQAWEAAVALYREQKAENGRLRLKLQISDEMVDRALNAWFASPPSETDQGLERSMRAALEAAFSLTSSQNS